MNDSTGKEDFRLSREVTRNTLDFFFFFFQHTCVFVEDPNFHLKQQNKRNQTIQILKEAQNVTGSQKVPWSKTVNSTYDRLV